MSDWRSVRSSQPRGRRWQKEMEFDYDDKEDEDEDEEVPVEVTNDSDKQLDVAENEIGEDKMEELVAELVLC